MKYVGTKILLVLFGTLLVVGCSNNPFAPSSITDETNIPNQAKEILINDGRFDRPYTELGQIDYTLRRYSSIFIDQIQLRKQAIDFLKQEALAKYGDKVDAIIDIEIKESTEEEGYNGTLNVTHIQGTAISFNPEKKAIAKHKTKYKAKSPKNTLPKTIPQDIEITPSEILK